MDGIYQLWNMIMRGVGLSKGFGIIGCETVLYFNKWDILTSWNKNI